jgi:hypothetical protein
VRTLAVCISLILVGFGFGWSRHQEILRLRGANAALEQQLRARQRAGTQSRGPEAAVVDTNELGTLRKDWSELMRLRSEIGQLRRMTRVPLPELQRQTDQTVKLAAQEEQRGPELLDARAARLQSSLVQNHLQYALLPSLTELAQAHDGQFPASFPEVDRMLAASPESLRWAKQDLMQTNHLEAGEAGLVGRSLSVSAHDFEFVPSAAPLTIKSPPTALLREVQAHALPGGGSARWVGFTSGRVEEVSAN